MTVTVLAANRPLTDISFCAWIAQALPCECIEYHRGFLAVGIDVDLLDEAAAHDAEQRVRSALGSTPLLRVGYWPKRLLLYRALVPFRKLAADGIEVLALGQQFVAFGIHPDTAASYYWPSGETPLDVPLGELPLVDDAMCRDLLGVRDAPSRAVASSRLKAVRAPGPSAPVRNDRGLVIDGRDAWLSSIAYHVLHNALDAGHRPDPAALATEAWTRFEGTAELARPRKDGSIRYGLADARQKVENKLRLHHDGRLPPRHDDVEANYQAPTLSADEARVVLDEHFGNACRAIEDWYETPEGSAPQIGIRGTVGLGKSIRARSHVLALRDRLGRQERPSRIVLVTPSHALAEEAADGWRRSGLQVAVLLGYHAKDPSGAPMCRDTDAVDIAIRPGTDVTESACLNRTGQTCPFFDGCLKQQNIHDVATADVVIAPYDTLFSGFSGDMDSIGVVIVDEACWPRAMQEERLPLDDLMLGTVASPGPRAGTDPDADMADLHALRAKLRDALVAADEPMVSRSALSSAGLAEEMCRLALNKIRAADLGNCLHNQHPQLGSR